MESLSVTRSALVHYIYRKHGLRLLEGVRSVKQDSYSVRLKITLNVTGVYTSEKVWASH